MRPSFGLVGSRPASGDGLEVISDGAPTGTVTTVLGNIDARSLGRTYYHEHLFQITPLLPGDELDDEDASRQEAALLRESGFDAMIDATGFRLFFDDLAKEQAFTDPYIATLQQFRAGGASETLHSLLRSAED
jgi:hypothetical protein